MREWRERAQSWVRERSREIIFVAGLLGVAVGSFEFGFVQGMRHTSPPMVIEKAAVAPSANATPSDVAQSSSPNNLPNAAATFTPTPTTSPSPGTCPFVGSRNSDKYHAASCAVVKRIKPENRVCFTSEEDARTKRYQPGCLQ